MTRSFPLHTACLALACALVVPPCLAESFASSASSAGSASSGSVSDSIKGSSGSSNRDKQVGEGQYRVIEVAEVPDRPAMTRLKLRATEPGATNEFFLDLPRHALADRPLGTGDLVQAHQRPYGFEFARDDTREAFFLVLTDDWHRELDPRVVSL
ncbi:MAG TPA: hypothetical protein VJO99_11900 [Burkholderiaceae bacterium]|nr:hypothetical protein [Burkholderiaceae bacterium]